MAFAAIAASTAFPPRCEHVHTGGCSERMIGSNNAELCRYDGASDARTREFLLVPTHGIFNSISSSFGESFSRVWSQTAPAACAMFAAT